MAKKINFNQTFCNIMKENIDISCILMIFDKICIILWFYQSFLPPKCAIMSLEKERSLQYFLRLYLITEVNSSKFPP